MNNVLHTKFGNARLDAYGYYHITSRKEGNMLKKLHRLIFEDFYRMEIPTGYDVHHKNGNRQDNCILNLQLVHKSEHTTKHHSKRELSSKLRTSRTMNKTGYFRVRKCINPKCKQGFSWKYQYYENKKTKSISSTSLEKLKERVLAKGLEWIKL